MSLERGRAEQLGHEPREHLFRELQHDLVVGIRLIPLGHRELGVVKPRQPFVPKVVPDLVHLLEPAHDTALQVQLVGDAEIEVRVERLVVRLERTRGGATVQRLQHGGLHFQIAARVEEPPDVAHHPSPQPEHLAHLGMHGQVRVALPGAQLGIRQLPVPHPARVLLAERQRPQRLREQAEPFDAHGDFARLGPE